MTLVQLRSPLQEATTPVADSELHRPKRDQERQHRYQHHRYGDELRTRVDCNARHDSTYHHLHQFYSALCHGSGHAARDHGMVCGFGLFPGARWWRLNSTPLTVYTVLSLGVNHIVYDPYSRKLMASVSTGSSSTNGSSLVAITPETATIGTPLPLSNVPTKLALSDSGQTLYVANSTASNIVRYNMLSGAMDTIAIPVSSNYSYYTPYAFELSLQPGTENTLALSLGNYYYTQRHLRLLHNHQNDDAAFRVF